MIQPINATTPRIGFKGSKNSYGLRAKGYTDSGAAMINAGGLSIAAGGITAAVARVYTQSWSQAGMLGLFGAFLTLFFMTPQLIDRFGIKKPAVEVVNSGALKQESFKVAEVVNHLKPVKRLVPFRSDNNINP